MDDNTTTFREFEQAMRRRYLSPGTIDKRMSHVRRFAAWHGDGWLSASSDAVEAWLDTLDVGPSARYCAVSHLSQFWRWAIRRDLVDVDPTTRIDRPRLPKGLPRPARADLVDLAIADAPPIMAAMLSLMADGGLRCCEVARLEWHDVDLAAGVLRFTGKGNRDRVVGIPRRLAGLLAALDGTVGPVIGERVTPTRVSQRVNDYLRRAGVGATAHQLRHLYGDRMLTATAGNLSAVQQALGHASITSTQIYAAAQPTVALDAARRLS